MNDFTQRLRQPTARALVLVTVWALIWAKAMGVLALANPFALDWMFEGDWQAHLFGWLFTQSAPWGLPFGLAPDLIAPTGSSAAFTDAIPIMALIGKAIGTFVSAPFQYFGLWMVLGFVGAGVTGVLVARGFVHDTLSLTLAGALCVLSPVFSIRYGHPAFMGFWILLGLVGVNLWPRPSRRALLVALVLLFIACGTHAYFAAMAIGLALAAMVRRAVLDGGSPREKLGWIALVPVVTAFGLFVFGFIAGARGSAQNLASEGFGQFSVDLATFINPSTWSRFLQPLPTGPRQYEGYGYLGLGVLLLLGLGAIGVVRQRPGARELLGLVPLVTVAVVSAVFAASNVITVLGKPIGDLSAFYARLEPLPAVFRSSGRFIWPMYLSLLLGAIVLVLRWKTAWLRQAVLGAALLVQVADFDPTRSPLLRQYPKFEPFSDPAWQLMRDYRNVVVSPIQLQWICPFDPPFMARLSWEAARQHLSINSGHVGRAPPGTDCRRHLRAEELDDRTVYIPYFPEYVPELKAAGFVCATVEGLVLCVSPSRETPLLAELLRRSR